ncbi:hypothetical protein Dda_2400 [Drechslerella dactyloides]|uniref:Uncharacterized protein n=1 Tax=Drechslerella dactyloides TaxID=74499 RepID=A0AAD6NNV6_DREDA|nr:hypothetical protein Dda_2400 [Drechslerella dactyloides]
MSDKQDATGRVPPSTKSGLPSRKPYQMPAMRPKGFTTNTASTPSSPSKPPEDYNLSRYDRKRSSKDKEPTPSQASMDWRARDDKVKTGGSKIGILAPKRIPADPRNSFSNTHAQTPIPGPSSSAQPKQRKESMITYPGSSRPDRGNRTGTLGSPVGTPMKTEDLHSPGLSTTVHGSETDVSPETSFQSSSSKSLMSPKSKIPFRTPIRNVQKQEQSRVSTTPVGPESPQAGFVKKIHNEAAGSNDSTSTETLPDKSALPEDTQKRGNGNGKEILVTPGSFSSAVNDSKAAKAGKSKKEENETRNQELQASIQNVNATPWPNHRIQIDFGLDSLFVDIKNIGLEEHSTASAKIQPDAGSARQGSSDDKISSDKTAESSLSMRVKMAVEEVLEETLAYWQPDSKNERQKASKDSKYGWRNVLRDLNVKVHGDIYRNRCMNDDDIADLLEFLEILCHDYGVHYTISPESKQTAEVRKYIQSCLGTFTSSNDTHTRRLQFLVTKSNLLGMRKSLWEQEFRASWEATAPEFRHAVTQGNTVIRNYYAPTSGHCINICEFDRESQNRGYKLLPDFRIEMSGAVKPVQREPAEEEYIWGESNSLVNSPPGTPPDRVPFKRGTKFDERWFDENGEFQIPEDPFFLINAISRPQTKKNDDESLIVIDASFVTAMERYIEEFAGIVGMIVEEMALEGIALNLTHFGGISSFLMTELKSRFALHENDLLEGIDSLNSMAIFGAMWDQLYGMFNATTKQITLQPYVAELTRKLSGHLSLVYSELQRDNRVILEIQGGIVPTATETVAPITHAALSTCAFSAGDFGTVPVDNQSTKMNAEGLDRGTTDFENLDLQEIPGSLSGASHERADG